MANATIVGTLGKDPKLSTTKNGKSMARFSIAWSERNRDANGEFHDGPTVWVSVTVFGRQAENAGQSLAKGMRVIVSGNLKAELWSSDRGEETVFTMMADHVGPDLTFATAQVVKNERGNFQQPAPQQGDPWGGAPQGGFSQIKDEPAPF